MKKEAHKTSPAIEWLITSKPIAYPKALVNMDARVEAMLAGQAGEMIWLLEHPSSYTAGTSARTSDLLNTKDIPVYPTGRGGQYTYHGPGQRVAYVMMDLAQRDRDLRAHVWRLEEWGIRALDCLGVRAERRKGRVGLWVTDDKGYEKKIAALGVRARRWITSHGIAINVDPDLSAYEGIVPCGLAAFGVTSLHAQGVNASMHALDEALKTSFEDVF